MKTKLLIPSALLLIVIAFVAGRLTGSHSGHGHSSDSAAASDIEFWTCSMHPQIKQPGPGRCPICAMDLVPVMKNSQASLGPDQIKLPEAAIALAGVQTVPVVREMPTVEVRMVGKVDYDETRLAYISARFPGRLERLFVDYTGVRVNKGDHMVEIYSPELLAAQEELLQAVRTARDLNASGNTVLRERAGETIQAARDKLLLWDLTPDQVAAIEKQGKPSDRLTLFAPTGGIVIRKEAVEGKYLQTGAPIYTIADLSRVWVLLDAYESDLAWLHFGQKVEFTSQAHPGRTFSGRIAFIDPTLNPKTRTVRVRVNIENPDGGLKPDMFVKAVVRSEIASNGRVMSPELAGKWISPMHPEIVRDAPGECPVCGMDLVSAESLGYLPASVDASEIPLIVPATAPLITGKRAVVYVAVKNQPGVFEGRVVELGPRAGELYIVKSGLDEGDRVVSNGFKIDSAVQILAKRSMMSPGENPGTKNEERGAATPVLDAPPEFRKQLSELVKAYFPMVDALSHDRYEDARESAAALSTLVDAVDMGLLEGDAHMAWMRQMKRIEEGIEGFRSAADIETARAAFVELSEGLVEAAESPGIAGGSSIYVYHCPMAAEGEGADWLQPTRGIENPYMGSKMFTCGTEVRVIGGQGADDTPAGAVSAKNVQHEK